MANERRPASRPDSGAEPAAPAGVDPQASPGKDPLLLTLGLLFLLFVLGIWLTHQWDLNLVEPPVAQARIGTGDEEAKQLKVTVFDTIGLPGAEVQVAAKYEADGPSFINPDQRKLAVVMGLHLEGENTATAETRTAGEGMARATFKAPERPGSYHLFTHPVARGYQLRPVTVAPQLFVVAASTPIIVCDLDDTVTQGGINVTKAQPHAGAAQVLTELARTCFIIYLTARDDGLLDRSRTWLDDHHFPRGPVLCRDWSLWNAARTGTFKKQALARLQQTYSRIVWGIGNSSGDQDAYTAAKIPHVMLAEQGGSEEIDGVKRIRVVSWSEIPAIIGTKK